MKYVLASASPRRREIFGNIICTDFAVIPSKNEEKSTATTVQGYVKELSYNKAKEVFDKTFGDVLVLGSDTVVAFNGKILGKPKTEEDAKQMLSALSDNVHSVITGVCVMARVNGKVYEDTQFDETEVEFLPLSEKFITDYIKTGSPMDKAGAYGIQDGGLVKRINGSYTCVVGLPQELTTQMIQKILSKVKKQ